MSQVSELSRLLETYLGDKATKLEVSLRISTMYNDEDNTLFYSVTNVAAKDHHGQNIPFIDPKTHRAVPAAHFNWEEPLERVLWAIRERYGESCWYDFDNDRYLSLVGNEWPEDPEDLESMGELYLPKTIVLDLDGNVLDIQEIKASEFLVEEAY